jgi:hypothetical protein
MLIDKLQVNERKEEVDVITSSGRGSLKLSLTNLFLQERL